MKFAVELASLGCFSTPLLQRIFQEEFLKKFLSREYNLLDQLQFLLLYQAVKTLYPSYVGPYPPQNFISAASQINGNNVEHFTLQSVLEKGLGGPRLAHSSWTLYWVAILLMSASCYSSNCDRLKGLPSLIIKTLEALNCCVLPVSYYIWTRLPDNEKIPYLMRELKVKYEDHVSQEGTAESTCEN